MQDAIDNAREQLRAPAGVVRASIANSFGKMFLIPKLGKFLEAYPGISLDLCFDDVPRDLISRGYDVEIRYGAPSDSRYICRRLCGLPLALVASPAYLARRGTPRTPHDLAAHDCITTSIGTRRAAWRFTPGSGGKSVIIHPTGHFNVADQLDGVIDGALAGLGITLAHRGAVRHFVERGDLATVLDDHVITSSARGGSAVYLLYPHREFLSNRVRLFIDFLSDCFSDSEYQEVAPDELEDGEVDLDALT
nr:substrate binding domain-containing protein [Sphingobium sp. JAI105]